MAPPKVLILTALKAKPMSTIVASCSFKRLKRKIVHLVTGFFEIGTWLRSGFRGGQPGTIRPFPVTSMLRNGGCQSYKFRVSVLPEGG